MHSSVKTFLFPFYPFLLGTLEVWYSIDNDRRLFSEPVYNYWPIKVASRGSHNRPFGPMILTASSLIHCGFSYLGFYTSRYSPPVYCGFIYLGFYASRYSPPVFWVRRSHPRPVPTRPSIKYHTSLFQIIFFTCASTSCIMIIYTQEPRNNIHSQVIILKHHKHIYVNTSYNRQVITFISKQLS